MSRKIYEAVIGTGQYRDKNGEAKTKWESVGSVIETDNGKKGLLLKRTFAPSGLPVDDKAPNCVFIPLFEPKSGNYGSYSAW